MRSFSLSPNFLEGQITFFWEHGGGNIFAVNQTLKASKKSIYRNLTLSSHRRENKGVWSLGCHQKNFRKKMRPNFYLINFFFIFVILFYNNQKKNTKNKKE